MRQKYCLVDRKETHEVNIKLYSYFRRGSNYYVRQVVCYPHFRPKLSFSCRRPKIEAEILKSHFMQGLLDTWHCSITLKGVSSYLHNRAPQITSPSRRTLRGIYSDYGIQECQSD